ncbi:MAG: type I-E CRISPR-associated protein Cse2/CasB [Alcaligenaceae bacterium]|jgi:CRISPR system Cascade subunit CasB|nr:type I-E CRISPR-associated protein Cse2/CasB [Alcaligenaceae bacterium]
MSREDEFVDYIIKRCQQDKGFAARLRRADNSATEYQSWEILGRWVDLENAWERLPYATVAAAIARSKVDRNGTLGLGQGLAKCYSDKNTESDKGGPANARLRRLLACNDTQEVCRVIRPLLTMIGGRVDQPLNYGQLLRDLRYFSEKSKIRWAQDFYRNLDKASLGEVE